MTSMLSISVPLVTDIDDVVLSWVKGGFGPYLTREHGITLNGPEPMGWDMSPWTGISLDETIAHLKTFNASEEFGNLPAFDCALDVLPDVAISGRPIMAVTSCAADPVVHARRRANLEAIFGDIFYDITCLDVGVSKTPTLQAIADEHGDCIWCEDNYKNALMGADVGMETYAFRRGHNREFENDTADTRVKWVDGWRDLRPRILGSVEWSQLPESF